MVQEGHACEMKALRVGEDQPLVVLEYDPVVEEEAVLVHHGEPAAPTLPLESHITTMAVLVHHGEPAASTLPLESHITNMAVLVHHGEPCRLTPFPLGSHIINRG